MESLKKYKECIFCNIQKKSIKENENCVSFSDNFPISRGHVLIIPKRHVSSYFELTDEERSDCWILVNEMKTYLQKKFNPAGFNIGINNGEAAGQTIMHCHIHLIPRYLGDVVNPKGGIRHVIPGKGYY
jgi:diadenosine tetraphosphate (Ap4A) HIT family hydrolase